MYTLIATFKNLNFGIRVLFKSNATLFIRKMILDKQNRPEKFVSKTKIPKVKKLKKFKYKVKNPMYLIVKRHFELLYSLIHFMSHTFLFSQKLNLKICMQSFCLCELTVNM